MEESEPQAPNVTLSAALRLIRAHRRQKSGEVAKAMNMASRSYEHFEAGGGKINFERIHQFAEATDSDAHAIVAALALSSPRFALRCADNKLMTIVMVAIQEFDQEVGDAIADLDGLTIINAFTATLKDLAVQSKNRDSSAEEWLEGKLVSLASTGKKNGNGGAP